MRIEAFFCAVQIGRRTQCKRCKAGWLLSELDAKLYRVSQVSESTESRVAQNAELRRVAPSRESL